MTVLKSFEVLLYYHFLLKMKKNELTHPQTIKLSSVYKCNVIFTCLIPLLPFEIILQCYLLTFSVNG